MILNINIRIIIHHQLTIWVYKYVYIYTYILKKINTYIYNISVRYHMDISLIRMHVCMYVCLAGCLAVCLSVSVCLCLSLSICLWKYGRRRNISKPSPQSTPPPSSSSAPAPPDHYHTFGRRRSPRSCWQGQPSGNTMLKHLRYRTLWHPWGSLPSFVNKLEASAHLGEGAMLCWERRTFKMID